MRGIGRRKEDNYFKKQEQRVEDGRRKRGIWSFVQMTFFSNLLGGELRRKCTSSIFRFESMIGRDKQTWESEPRRANSYKASPTQEAKRNSRECMGYRRRGEKLRNTWAFSLIWLPRLAMYLSELPQFPHSLTHAHKHAPEHEIGGRARGLETCE